MIGEEIFSLLTNSVLRQAIVDQARQSSHRPEVQADYLRDAWLTISCGRPGKSIEVWNLPYAVGKVFSGASAESKVKYLAESMTDFLGFPWAQGKRTVKTIETGDPWELLWGK